jgi:hypothetical protein
LQYTLYTAKKGFSIFPSPAGMSLSKLSLGWNNDVIYILFPPGGSLVSDIPAGDGNIEKLFFYHVHIIRANTKTINLGSSKRV